MISLKKYLDQEHVEPTGEPEPAPEQRHEPRPAPRAGAEAGGLLDAAMEAYRSALRSMGSSSIEACPQLGEELRHGLGRVDDTLTRNLTVETIAGAERNVHGQLEDWGRRTAQHYQKKTDEVKEILMVMARTVESVSDRDKRATSQLAQVTGRLKKIATLEDLSLIRNSIEESATELKNSIERITNEGKAAIQQMQTQISTYQAKLEEAGQIVSVDSLTGLRSRFWMERFIERRMKEGAAFCLVIVDVDHFKRVNDRYGHQIGDELLRQFSTELKSALRSNAVVARWGGDEFLILLDFGLAEAQSQVARIKKWVCGSYTLQGRQGSVKLDIGASLGLAERLPNESMKDLVDRADGDMYSQKAASRTIEARIGR